MLKDLFKSKIICTTDVIILVLLLASCFIVLYLMQNPPKANYYSNSEMSDSYKVYKVEEQPNGSVIEASEGGFKVISSDGEILHESYKKLEFCEREGYIYEIDKYGRFSIVNLDTGEVEKTFLENEKVLNYASGFWIVRAEVIDDGLYENSYYYLLDENYQIGANGIIFNTIEYTGSDNYIYGSRELSYTMYNRDGIEERDHNNESCVVDSSGEIVYVTDGNSYIRSIEGDIARIKSYVEDVDDVYISLKGPNKGQVVKVNRDE